MLPQAFQMSSKLFCCDQPQVALFSQEHPHKAGYQQKCLYTPFSHSPPGGPGAGASAVDVPLLRQPDLCTWEFPPSRGHFLLHSG